MDEYSTYFPKKDEVDKLYSYELEKRNGYIYSSCGTTSSEKKHFRPSGKAVVEGKVEGQILDIKPVGFQNHPFISMENHPAQIWRGFKMTAL